MLTEMVCRDYWDCQDCQLFVLPAYFNLIGFENSDTEELLGFFQVCRFFSGLSTFRHSHFASQFNVNARSRGLAHCLLNHLQTSLKVNQGSQMVTRKKDPKAGKICHNFHVPIAPWMEQLWNIFLVQTLLYVPEKNIVNFGIIRTKAKSRIPQVPNRMSLLQ